MERIQSLLFAVFVGRRFREVGQARKLTNLVSHLKTQHHVVYREYEKQRQKSLEVQEDQPTTSAKAKQLTIKENREQTQVWDINNA